MKIKHLFIVGYLIWGIAAHATSIKSISIGVNGLTCSMCTRSVEMSIRKLDFVDSVVMDLENTEGKVYLKKGGDIDLRKVAKAVTSAGFSVRFMRIQVDFEDSIASTCFSIGPDSFQFIHEPNVSGYVELILIGDEFMPRKELADFKKKLVQKCPAQNGYYVSSR
jgi:copper chaperone CopZ